MPKLNPNIDRLIRIAAKLETVMRDWSDYDGYLKMKPDLANPRFQSAVEKLISTSLLMNRVEMLNAFFDNKKKYEKIYLDIYGQMLKQCVAKRKMKTYTVFMVRDYFCFHLPKDHPLLSPTIQNYNKHFDEYFDNGSDMYDYDEELAKDGFNSLGALIGWEIQRQLDKPD